MTDEANKKIIIDEDWKSQVEAERQSTDKKESAAESAAQGESAAQPEADVPLPPADLLFLASSLYMQAAVSLGLVANPITGKPEKRLPQAKHAIDTLQVLQEKTQGNRTEEESRAIETLLHEIRMSFVAAQK